MDTTQAERRRQKRMRALLGAHVVTNNKYSTIDCVVRDITDNGARLRFGGSPYLQQEFELHITGRNEKRKARKVWMRDGDMGVAFD